MLSFNIEYDRRRRTVWSMELHQILVRWLTVVSMIWGSPRTRTPLFDCSLPRWPLVQCLRMYDLRRYSTTGVQPKEATDD